MIINTTTKYFAYYIYARGNGMLFLTHQTINETGYVGQETVTRTIMKEGAVVSEKTLSNREIKVRDGFETIFGIDSYEKVPSLEKALLTAYNKHNLIRVLVATKDEEVKKNISKGHLVITVSEPDPKSGEVKEKKVRLFPQAVNPLHLPNQPDLKSLVESMIQITLSNIPKSKKAKKVK